MDLIIDQMMTVAEYIGWETAELRPVRKLSSSRSIVSRRQQLSAAKLLRCKKERESRDKTFLGSVWPDKL